MTAGRTIAPQYSGRATVTGSTEGARLLLVEPAAEIGKLARTLVAALS